MLRHVQACIIPSQAAATFISTKQRYKHSPGHETACTPTKPYVGTYSPVRMTVCTSHRNR